MKIIKLFCSFTIISFFNIIAIAQEANDLKILTDWESGNLNRPVKSIKMVKNGMPGPMIAESTCYFNQQGFYTMCQIEMISPSKATWIISYHPYQNNQRTIDILFTTQDGNPQPIISETQVQEKNKTILKQKDTTTIEHFSNLGKTTHIETIPTDPDQATAITYYYYEDDEPNLDKTTVVQNLKSNEKAVFNTKLKKDGFGQTIEVREEMSDGTITIVTREIQYY